MMTTFGWVTPTHFLDLKMGHLKICKTAPFLASNSMEIICVKTQNKGPLGSNRDFFGPAFRLVGSTVVGTVCACFYSVVARLSSAHNMG